MEDTKKRIVNNREKRAHREYTCEEIRVQLKESEDNPDRMHEIVGLPHRFEPIRILGAGGMGTVYHVLDKNLDTEFAIKFMSAQSMPDETARQRFKLEAAAVHELVHPNIVQVYDYSTSEQAPYIVMEYVPGASFERILARERIIEEHRLLNMILQICDALNHAHLHGIVHRDLKPSNIILHESSDLLKLVDFGIAKVGPQNESATQLTQKGEVFGSPSYMSPEQACAGKIDHRTDLYSLGCIMYEALAGKPLFTGENAVQILLQHINTSPLSMTRKLLKKGYSKSLVAILEKLLEKEPDRRYQSAGDLAEDVRRVLRNQLSKALMKKPFLISVSRKAVLTTLAASCVASMLGLCAYTTVTVMQLKKTDPNEARVFDSMVSKRNQAKELIERIINNKGEDRTLALHALLALITTPWSPGLSGSQSMDLLDQKDQLVLMSAFDTEPDQETKKKILQILSRVQQPEQALLALVSKLSFDKDEVLSPVAISCLCSWASKCEKKFPEISTSLSTLLLKTKTNNDDPLNEYFNLNYSVCAAFKDIKNYTNEAIKNIRESARMLTENPEDEAFRQYRHPLIYVARMKKTYYPELACLLKIKYERSVTLQLLSDLGPKAAPVVPELLKLLKSPPDDYSESSLYHTLGSIGPAAAKEAVPVLKANYSRHRLGELPLIARALAKMGPMGIAVLKEEASRKRMPEGQYERSPNNLSNAAIDAAKDALVAAGES